MASKIKEAEEHVKKAEKYMKTGLMKWSPDLDSAVDEYSQAALCFKNGKNFEKSYEMYMKTAEIYYKQGNHFHSAKNTETAISVIGDDAKRVSELANKACSIYMEGNVYDGAQSVMTKAGKQLTDVDLETAASCYRRAAEIAEMADRLGPSAELFGKAGRLLIRAEKYSAAVPMLKEEQRVYHLQKNGGNVNRLQLCLVVTQIKADNLNGAAETVEHGKQTFACFQRSEQEEVVCDIVGGLQSANVKAAVRGLSNPLFKYLDNEFAILARDVLAPLSKTLSEQEAAEADSAATHGLEETDDGDIDLT